MTLTTAEAVRLRIQDPWRFGTEVLYGDGSTSAFQLQQGAPYSTMCSATASVVVTGWSATGCTVDTTRGHVTFSGIISANTAVRMDYLWAVFSDAEVGFFTAEGSVRKATLLACRTLMGNAWKRARWAAPDGSQYDDSKAMANLREWEKSLIAERTVEVGPEGGIASWSETQEDYS